MHLRLIGPPERGWTTRYVLCFSVVGDFEPGILSLKPRTPVYDSVQEIHIDGPVSDGASLPFEIVVRPTLIVFQPVTPPAPASEKPPGPLLSTEQAAMLLAISEETLRRLCRRKAITFIRVASEYRFTKADWASMYLQDETGENPFGNVIGFDSSREAGTGIEDVKADEKSLS